jgi:hypothetical protein
MEKKVMKFIETVRESFEGASKVYTRGSCYQFYLILKRVFPEAEAYYDLSHVITKIGDEYYDINGIAKIENHVHFSEWGPDTLQEYIKYSIYRDSKILRLKCDIMEEVDIAIFYAMKRIKSKIDKWKTK